MAAEKVVPIEETLDPEDWDSMRILGHRMLDDMLDYLEKLTNHPVWQHTPDVVKANFDTALPLDPQSPDAIYEEYLKYIHPYLFGNNHPRFWGWIAGTGTVIEAIAELLASATNSPSGAFAFMSANHVENQVIGWFKVMVGFPTDASGLLTSGCSEIWTPNSTQHRPGALPCRVG